MNDKERAEFYLLKKEVEVLIDVLQIVGVVAFISFLIAAMLLLSKFI